MRSSNKTLPTLLALLALGAGLALAPGCDPPEDSFIRNGGAAPDPAGVVEGTVLYIGPKPQCERDNDGEPTSILGNVILTLFVYDNPPPPEGSATSASNILVVSGAELFDLTDCMPLTPGPADLAPIMRSVDFAWPEIALAVGEPDPETGERPGVDYQIRGFFDYDDDFNPFFSVRRLGTRGDIAGGAFRSIAETPPVFQRISFGNIEDLPNGQVVQGIAVTLAAPINTEMPVVTLGEGTHALRSQDTVPISADRTEQEQSTFELTDAHLTTVDIASAAWQRTLTAAGMIRPLPDGSPDPLRSFDTGPTSYGFYVLQVDTNRDGNRDAMGNLGGMPEPHPILGLLGIGNYHPMVVMRRARNPIEAAAGVPTVVLLPSPRPSQVEDSDVFDGRRLTFSSDIDLVVPPVAVMFTTPTCRIPLIAPRNVAELYASSPSDCQELPTGNYDINLITGVAGARPVNYRDQVTAENPGATPAEIDAMVAAVTDNDWILAGGAYSSQAWSIPNELGCPDRAYNRASRNQLDDDESVACTPGADTAMQVSQGPAGRFSVVDHDGGNAPMFDNLEDGHGVSTCQSAFSITELRQVPVTYMDISEECCAPIMHLCGLPLCPLRDIAADPENPDQLEIRAALPDTEGNRDIREMRIAGEDYTQNANGSVTPLCTPFLMPVSCCRRAAEMGMGGM